MKPMSGIGRRFVIIGLPRSGTTYLMSLLNSHPAVSCAGEQFNPYASIGVSRKVDDRGTIFGRDSAPVEFMDNFFRKAESGRETRVGFKFMIGHNVTLLDEIAKREDLTLIYVHRANRLAQISSLFKALHARKWAQRKADDHLDLKIDVGPLKISHRWHEFATFDRLFKPWFDALPHRKMSVEYREMFAPSFNDELCKFLGVEPDKAMKSPLIKQSSNQILNRFENPEPISRYFTKVGKAEWLQPEL